jgi:type I restriction enzyme S subunit
LPLRFFLDTKSTFGIPQVQGLEETGAKSSKGWKMARVGDILKIRNGYAFKSSDYQAAGIPLIRQSELRSDVVDTSGAKRVDQRFLAELPGFTVCEGDLLIGMSGSLGKISEYQEKEPALQNQRTGLLILKPGYDAKFAKLVLKFVEPQIVAEGKGVAVQNVSAKEIEDCTFPLPPPAEQKQIVAEIEKQFTRLEAGVSALKRVQANLKRYRAAVLKAACEGKLVPTEAELCRERLATPPKAEAGATATATKQSEVAKSTKKHKSGDQPTPDTRHLTPEFETGAELLERILIERRKNWSGRGKYKDPAAPDTTNLPPLPEGWAWATVEQLAAPEPNSITDGPFGSNLKTEHYTDSGPRVIRLQNIGDGIYVDEEAHISQAHFERLQKHRIFPNDVVIAGFGESPPRSCIIPEALGPAIVKADCIRFKPHSSVMPKYMNAALNSDPVRKRTKGMVHGVGRPRLNLGEIRSISLPLPPLAEQMRIVAEAERRLSVVEELETVVSANLQRATRLRQSILQKAFEGNL